MTILKIAYYTQLRRNVPSMVATATILLVGLAVFKPIQAKDTMAGMGRSEFGNYLAGRQAQFDSNPRFAVKYYLSVLEKSPNNLLVLQRIISLLVSEGRIEEALSKAQHHTKISGSKSNISNLILALTDVKRQQFLKASQRIDQLPNDGINSFLIPMLNAWLLASQKKSEEALKIIDKKIKNPGLSALFGIHGALISEFAGNNENAISRYKAVANSHKNANLRTTILLGNLYERIGQKENAKAVYDSYKSLKPSSTMLDDTYNRLISGGTLKSYNRTIVEGISEALFSIGSAIQNQKPYQAIIFSRLAIYLNPNFSIAKLLLAETLEENVSLSEANKIYKELSSQQNYGWAARLRIANNLDRLGETDKAVHQLRSMAIENTKKTDALIKLGNLLQRHKRYQASINAYEQAKRRIQSIKKQHWALHFSLGISYERLKRWPLAERNLLKALELRPNHPSVLNYLGYSWVEQGLQLKRAQKMIENAVKQRPRDGYIIDSLGWVFYRLGNIKEAIKQLERAVQIRPEDPTINDHLGDIYWTAGRRNEAKFQWNKALTLDPERDQIPKIKLKLKVGLPEKVNEQKGI